MFALFASSRYHGFPDSEILRLWGIQTCSVALEGKRFVVLGVAQSHIAGYALVISLGILVPGLPLQHPLLHL